CCGSDAHACTRLGQTELAAACWPNRLSDLSQVRSPLELAKCWTVAADIDQRSQHYEQALETWIAHALFFSGSRCRVV
ncbi:MAG: hypothetical protein HC876_03870, partial [Chloroflexaceae bacterium]|nr:hypothetical protein [Chloroflexaceae bacterium]